MRVETHYNSLKKVVRKDKRSFNNDMDETGQILGVYTTDILRKKERGMTDIRPCNVRGVVNIWRQVKKSYVSCGDPEK